MEGVSAVVMEPGTNQTGDPGGGIPSETGFQWRPGRSIPWGEITFAQDAAGGPGGQHANRTATRVSLIWSPDSSEAFSDSERRRLRKGLATRLNRDGQLRLRYCVLPKEGLP